MFTRQYLKYWSAEKAPTCCHNAITPEVWRTSRTLCSLFSLKDIWGGSITHSAPGRKCSCRKPSQNPAFISCIRTSSFSADMQTVCLSLCTSVQGGKWAQHPCCAVHTWSSTQTDKFVSQQSTCPYCGVCKQRVLKLQCYCKSHILLTL